MVSKGDKNLLSRYEFNLQIKEKATGYADVIDIDGAKNLHNIFLPDVVKILVDGIRASEVKFNAKLASGELVQAPDGNFDMKGFVQKSKVPHFDKPEEKLNIPDNIKQTGGIEHIKSKKDFTTGKEFDKDE
jgi:hypothetical protein